MSADPRARAQRRRTTSTAARPDTQSLAPHVAESHDLIRVYGARENNLKDISVELPKRGRIVFEGRPADLVAARATLTGEHLAAYVGI
jgi:hypothetical protein